VRTRVVLAPPTVVVVLYRARTEYRKPDPDGVALQRTRQLRRWV
jgi:hypothetical protein